MSSLFKNEISMRYWVFGFNHLLGVEIIDSYEPVCSKENSRYFEYTDKDRILNGDYRLSFFKFFDEDGDTLDYLEYMKKYYPSLYSIAEDQCRDYK